MSLPPSSDPFRPTLSRSTGRARDAAELPQLQDARSAVMRKFRISCLTRQGQVHEIDQIGPAIPIFEAAFSAFTHGTLIRTDEGPVAIEDLQPGMHLVTADRGLMPLLWIGAMTLVPERNEFVPGGAQLTRIMADSLGPARPDHDLMAGPGARLLSRRSDMHDIVGADFLLTPAQNLVDGVNIISITPPRPITVYHLCLHRHATIYAAGLEAETFHPGPGFERGLSQEALSLFLSFFPHIHSASDFGRLAHPRVSVSGQSEIS